MTPQEIHKIISDSMHKYKYCITGHFSTVYSTPFKFGKYKTIEAANDALYQLKINGHKELKIENYFYGDYDGFYKRYYFEIMEMFKNFKYRDFDSNSYVDNYGFIINETTGLYLKFSTYSFNLLKNNNNPYITDNSIYKSSKTHNYEELYDELIIFKEFILPKYL